MKILFIGREKSNGRLSPILTAQGESLIRAGEDIHYFPVCGKGFTGYLSAIYNLRKLLKSTHFDIYHAHYYASGVVASLSSASPLAVSLMGSDLKSGWVVRCIVNSFIRFSWQKIIVKADIMLEDIKHRGKVSVIPNGVNMSIFRPLDKINCQKQVNFPGHFRHILFLSDPCRKEKNYKLAEDALRILSDDGIKLHVLHGIEYEKMPVFLSAADLLLLTSYYEGSPNVVKEAMACNLPVVSTPVGDVPEIIKGTEGCYIAGFEPADVADKIRRSLLYPSCTDGRSRIKHLDSQLIAAKLISVYKSILI